MSSVEGMSSVLIHMKMTIQNFLRDLQNGKNVKLGYFPIEETVFSRRVIFDQTIVSLSYSSERKSAAGQIF